MVARILVLGSFFLHATLSFASDSSYPRGRHMRAALLSIFLISTANAAEPAPYFEVGQDQVLRVNSDEQIDVPFFVLKGTTKVSVNGLMITTPNPYPPFTDTYFDTANTLCGKLQYRGVSNWRLPTLKEMVALGRLGLWEIPEYSSDEYFWVAMMSQKEYDEENQFGRQRIIERCRKADYPKMCTDMALPLFKDSLDDEANIFRSFDLINGDTQKLKPSSKAKAKFFCVKTP